MIRYALIFAVLAIVAPVKAAVSPLESDFADGYWDREFSFGRQTSNYNISIAAEDPLKVRRSAEAVLKAAGGTLTSFNDMTSLIVPEQSYSAMQGRPAYSISFQLPETKAAAAAREVIPLGRLLTYNTGSPYGLVQTKDIEERIEWIEKERLQSATALKTMPVSRAMLESRLKKLRLQLDQTRTGRGTTTVMVQIMRELPPPERGPGAAP